MATVVSKLVVTASASQVARVGLVVLRVATSISLVVTAKVDRVGVAVVAVSAIWAHKRNWDPAELASVSMLSCISKAEMKAEVARALRGSPVIRSNQLRGSGRIRGAVAVLAGFGAPGAAKGRLLVSAAVRLVRVAFGAVIGPRVSSKKSIWMREGVGLPGRSVKTTA